MNLGFGLGLRSKHYQYIFDNKPKVDWFEIISENFMDTGGKPIKNLLKVRRDYPIVMHGVSMSIGTIDPLDDMYLRLLKNLICTVSPAWVSDHLCWTGVAHKNIHDLLPLPYTNEALDHIVSRINYVQEYLGREIAIENPSTYLEFAGSEMSEADFVSQMAKRSGCKLLLDVNNIYVTCFNHKIDPMSYVDALPLDSVIQIHLAGHTNKGTHIIDTHDDHVIPEVWELYKYVVMKAKRVPNTMVEWDDKIPEFPVLFDELQKARLAAQSKDFDPSALDFAKRRAEDNPPIGIYEAQYVMQTGILNSMDADVNWIREKEHLSKAEQLQVYKNAYRWRLYDVVAEDLPVLKEYLGNVKFSDLISSFVEKTQSEHFNIARYIEHLREFIQAYLPEDSFAHNLCDVEITISRIADELENDAVNKDLFSNMEPEELLNANFTPRAALKLFAFNYNINEFYQSVMDEDKTSPKLMRSYLCIYRDDDVIWRLDLEQDEYTMLNSLFNGRTLGELLDGNLNVEPEKMQRWFARWVHNNIICDVKYDKEDMQRNVVGN